MRVSVAVALSAVIAVAVAVAVATATMVAVAAAVSVVAGAVASRMLHSELLQTRRGSARTCAEQARSFAQAMAASHDERMAFSDLMSGRVLERDLAVSRLSGALRIAERRADDAESRAEDASGRARQEARRAEQTRQQLGSLLDEVFGTAIVDEDFDSGLATELSAAG